MKTVSRFVLGSLVLIASSQIVGCGDGSDGVGHGTLQLRISGEGAAKQGYPFVKDDQTIAFADGWSVRFTKVLVALGGLRLRTFDGTEGFASDEVFVADLHRGDPTIVTIPNLRARRWDRFAFQIAPPTSTATNLNGVAAADLELMASQGLTYWIEGSATKDADTYTFRWGLKNPTRNTSCTNGLDNTDGFVVRTNATTTGEITIHLDHMFWDTLGTERANLRFEAIAAATGDRREITFDDLATQPLHDLRGRDGQRLRDERGQFLIYNPGSIPLTASTLQAFISSSSASQAHVNGTGLCTVSSL